MEKKKIVIIGAGFGGIYVARKLKKLIKSGLIEVTLINKTNYFLFTPLLHEVATGGLSPISATEPIREIIRNKRHLPAGSQVQFRQAEVTAINLDEKIVETNNEKIKFDYLVLATGAETNFHGISGAKENSLPLKSLRDALSIRARIIDSFEKAASEPVGEKRTKLLTFVVVGAGATGAELVAEIAEFVVGTLYPYYADTFCKKRDIKIILISREAEILSHFPKKLRDWSLQILNKKGISVLRDTSVTKIHENGVSLGGGQKILSSNIFWTAGVSPVLPKIIGNIELTENNRVKVDQNLLALNQDSVFVLGDVAYFKSDENGAVPMLAQVAVNQAKTVAENLQNILSGKQLRSFKYKSMGSLISLGEWQAVGDIFGFKIKGRFAWWLWRTVYLFKFLSWKKRFRIAFEWTINLFFSRDTTKIN
ncbi:MAG: NAD(P)/FAD-dependent oxidoreductase [Patescibacteria group bacterium]